MILYIHYTVVCFNTVSQFHGCFFAGRRKYVNTLRSDASKDAIGDDGAGAEAEIWTDFGEESEEGVMDMGPLALWLVSCWFAFVWEERVEDETEEADVEEEEEHEEGGAEEAAVEGVEEEGVRRGVVLECSFADWLAAVVLGLGLMLRCMILALLSLLTVLVVVVLRELFEDRFDDGEGVGEGDDEWSRGRDDCDTDTERVSSDVALSLADWIRDTDIGWAIDAEMKRNEEGGSERRMKEKGQWVCMDSAHAVEAHKDKRKRDQWLTCVEVKWKKRRKEVRGEEERKESWSYEMGESEWRERVMAATWKGDEWAR